MTTLDTTQPVTRISAGWLERPIVGGLVLWLVSVVLRLVAVRYTTMRRFLEIAPPGLADRLSHARAIQTARAAARQVPAYRRHLAGRGVDPTSIRRVDDLPETDKESYIDRHSLADRCLGGTIPMRNTTIDESSGSTGTPYNWVRGETERQHVRRMISFFARYTFGDEPLVILNAFSMGAWATGLTTAIALERNGLVKATGPDVAKIIGTLRQLGPGYRYLIVGYPPFLKLLLDVSEADGFDWSAYEVDALLGGEGNSEGLRDYLLRRFSSVFSGYGATDVEIGLAAETPICIELRRLALRRPEVAEALFGERSRVPMVFQYNPFLHHVETNAAGELLFTVTRHGTISPKVRYNVHDEGGVLRDDELRRRLALIGLRLEELLPPGSRRLVRMPYLYVFGRKDSTVSIMGANIYPQDLESAIYGDESLAAAVRSFQLSVVEPAPGETRPCVSIELERDEPSAELSEQLRSAIERQLLAVNRDYQEAAREYPELMPPLVRLYRVGEGPFAEAAGRIKRRYIAA